MKKRDRRQITPYSASLTVGKSGKTVTNFSWELFDDFTCDAVPESTGPSEKVNDTSSAFYLKGEGTSKEKSNDKHNEIIPKSNSSNTNLNHPNPKNTVTVFGPDKNADIIRGNVPINFPKTVDNKMRLNSFLLPMNVVKKMTSSVESSLFNNKEIGFNLCKKNNEELIDDVQHTGTEHDIRTIRNCIKGKYVGQFHTHSPIGGGKSDLSFFDIANIYHDEIGCVGGTLDGLIYCHIRKSDIDTKIKEKIVAEANRFERKLLPNGSLRHEDKLEYDKTIKKLQEELFDTFLITELYED